MARGNAATAKRKTVTISLATWQTWLLAARRRWSLWRTGDFNPYTSPVGAHLSPSERHFADYDRVAPALSWRRAGRGDARAWQDTARHKLAELMGYARIDSSPQAHSIEEHRLDGGLRRQSLYLRISPAQDIPIHLIWDPARVPHKRWSPILCLQGTNSGAHLSWGEARFPSDPPKTVGGYDFGRQAARRGYLAVCIEQSCFGERRERRLYPRSAAPCIDAANHALLLGRCLLGERVADVSAVIDWLFAESHDWDIDRERLYLMGHSAGGSVALFAAALDLRVAAVLASGCIGYVRDTIARRRDDQGQNVIPGILRWFELDDVVALCAPRPLLTVSGHQDHIWPYAGAQHVIESARTVYAMFGAESRLAAQPAEGGHRFYPDIAWLAFERLLSVGG